MWSLVYWLVLGVFVLPDAFSLSALNAPAVACLQYVKHTDACVTLCSVTP
jgi:hypothetical protein